MNSHAYHEDHCTEYGQKYAQFVALLPKKIMQLLASHVRQMEKNKEWQLKKVIKQKGNI